MTMGRNQSWEPYSKGMTHAFVLEFASAADRDYYILRDPAHISFSQSASPLIEDSLVVDIEPGNLFGSAPSRPSFPTEYKGSCHCGSIEWTAVLETPEHILCHCGTCKKLGGGPYSLNQIIGREDLVITKGSPSTYTYTGDSGKSVRCYFCGECTSHVYHHQEIMGDKIIVRTILLEGGEAMQPGGEIFGQGKLGWVEDVRNGLPS
ncbi:hypothetical protein MMC13_004322 [Lambiella insularis]|nr:hypothetical protein [Lambiella insularis]